MEKTQQQQQFKKNERKTEKNNEKKNLLRKVSVFCEFLINKANKGKKIK